MSREIPFLFTGPMVRAILDGSKTETRRVVKPQPVNVPDGYYFAPYNKGPKWNLWTPDHKMANSFQGDTKDSCQWTAKTQAGDIIWVKEAHYWDRFEEVPQEKPEDFPVDFYYRADGECCQQIPECQCGSEGKPKWRPSIFMPRWASRIDLLCTAVRVERLHEITEDGAIAEGIPKASEEADKWPTKAYKDLWESINGEGSWQENPFVFVYQFRRIKP